MKTSARVIVPCVIDMSGEARRHSMYGNYLSLLFSCDLLPVMVSPFMPPAMLEEVTAEASGLLLCGGVDVEPARYGAERHPQTEPSCPERDQFELDLIALFRQKKKPILGICRGAQLLAVESGGTLHQHVPELVQHESHGNSEVQTANDLFRAPRHEILPVVGSLAASLIGEGAVSVNTAHHQAIASVGSSLSVSAVSPGGITEIVESALADQFVFGIQAHPESDRDETLRPLVTAFADAVKTFHEGRK